MKKKEANLTYISNTVDEIKELYKTFLKVNGNSSLRISNKEFNLWIVKKLLEQDGKILHLEVRQKLIYLLITGVLIKLLVIP